MSGYPVEPPAKGGVPNPLKEFISQHPREVPTIRGPKPETESQPHPSDQKPQYTWPEPKKGK